MPAAVIPPGADRFGTCVLLRLPPVRRAVSFYFDTSQFPFLFFIFTLFGKKLSVRTAFFFRTGGIQYPLSTKAVPAETAFDTPGRGPRPRSRGQNPREAPGFWMPLTERLFYCVRKREKRTTVAVRFLLSLCLCEKLPRLAHVLVDRSAQRFRGVETHFRPQELVQLDVDHLAV